MQLTNFNDSFSTVASMCCREASLSRSGVCLSSSTGCYNTWSPNLHRSTRMCGKESAGEALFTSEIHKDVLCGFMCFNSYFELYPTSVLTYIFMIDVNLPYTQPTTSPRISDFTERILLQLKPLTEGDEEIQNHVVEENEVGEQDERTQAIKLLKTGGLELSDLFTVLHSRTILLVVDGRV